MTEHAHGYKILFLRLSGKGGDQPVNQVGEIKEILQAVQGKPFIVKDSEGMGVVKLQEWIRQEKPDIIHISGHGQTDQLQFSNFYYNVFKDQPLQTDKLIVQQIEAIFGPKPESKKAPRLLFINACFAAEIAKELQNSFDYAIGMQNLLDQSLALQIAKTFYEEIARGNTIKGSIAAIEQSIPIFVIDHRLQDNEGKDPCPQVYGDSTVEFDLTTATNRGKLTAGADGLGLLSTSVPELPKHYLPRPNEIRALKELLHQPEQDSVNRVIGICGMGGSGKSLLAAELARDADIRRAFPDGIVWVTLGQEGSVTGEQRNVFIALTGRPPEPEFVTEAEGKERLREFFDEEACLLIVDDVWNANHARAFNVLGKRSCLLITTRNVQVVEALGGQSLRLEQLSDRESLQLLANASGQPIEALPAVAKQVAEECGNLPLALAMVGAMAKGKPNLWEGLLKRLRNADLEKISKQESLGYSYRTLFAAIQISVEELEPAQKERYFDFAVFPEDISIPEIVLKTFWEPENLDELDIDEMTSTFVDRSLAREDKEGGLVLHDLLRDYIRKQIQDLPALHQRLLEAYQNKCSGEWHTYPSDGYFFEWLAYHLKEAGRTDELHDLLLDYRWLLAKLRNSSVLSLLADYGYLPEDRTLKLVQGGIRLSANALTRDPNQLPGQLLGRLLGLTQHHPALKSLLTQAQQEREFSWLRPLAANLTPPSGPLQLTLSGHNSGVSAVVLTPDGTCAVSASYDRTLKVWDLGTGSELHTLTGHEDSVSAVVLTPDGTCAVSASYDRTLKVWDLGTGSELHTLTGHEDSVSAVVLTPDGTRAVSASRDNTLKVWDLGTGSELHTLTGHTDWVDAVVLTPDGTRAVSASRDNTLKVWDLGTGSELHTLTGHEDVVTAVVLTPDGTRAVSASYRALRVWDLDSGSQLHTLTGYDSSVSAVVLTPDGTRAVSALWDKTLRVWDLSTGSELHILTGHENVVTAVVLTPDGTRAVSASENGTLKVWDLDSGSELHTLTGHDSGVTAVVLTPDGTRAISASNDRTLKVWDLGTGSELHTLTGHDSGVTAVVLTPDGTRAVSASADKTLKVWDLGAGSELHTLTGHEDAVTAVVLTPDGTRAVSASDDRTLRVWDVGTGSELHTLTGHNSLVTAVALTPDGTRAVSASADETLKVWDLDSGSQLHTLTGHDSVVIAVVLTPDGTRAVSASYDGTLKVWDLDSGSELHTLTGHEDGVTAVALTPDGTRAVSASDDRTLKVWDLDSGSQLHTLTGHDSFVDAVVVTPDGTRAVSASYDRTLKVCDLDSGSQLHTLTGHEDVVAAVALTPDGTRAVSASADKTLKVWDLATGEPLVTFVSEASYEACRFAPLIQTIVAGDRLGRVHFLKLEGLQA